MRALVIGGAGFVGLNIAVRLAGDGYDVTALDLQRPPKAILDAIAETGARIAFAGCDVTRPNTLVPLITRGVDIIIYGAAITADAQRDATEPERILAVNLGGLVPILRAARDAGVRRIINLSSGAALGRAIEGRTILDENVPPEPVSLYAITKQASERLAARLADLWSLDVVSVRLSSVFGPFEYATGVRDTLSPLGQIMMAATRGGAAILARPGVRDWVYVLDVADAIVGLVRAEKPAHRLYNITSGQSWAAIDWGEALARRRSNFSCRLAEADESPTIDLHAAIDRPPLSAARMRDDIGWQAQYDCDASLAHFDEWARHWGKPLWESV